MPDAPDLDPTMPAWVWIIQIVAWVFVLVGLPLLTYLLQKSQRDLRDTKQAAEATKDQTTNSHEGAEYPNLREEITQRFAAQERTLSQIRSELGGIRDDAARDRQANHETLMQAMTQQVPNLVAAAIASHVKAEHSKR